MVEHVSNIENEIAAIGFEQAARFDVGTVSKMLGFIFHPADQMGVARV